MSISNLTSAIKSIVNQSANEPPCAPPAVKTPEAIVAEAVSSLLGGGKSSGGLLGQVAAAALDSVDKSNSCEKPRFGLFNGLSGLGSLQANEVYVLPDSLAGPSEAASSPNDGVVVAAPPELDNPNVSLPNVPEGFDDPVSVEPQHPWQSPNQVEIEA